MKKITAFFMALMPLLVTILLFAAGLIVKNATHVYVSSVELPQQSVPIKVEDTTKEKTYQMEANVLPHNATNPKVKWTTNDTDGKILTINNDGVITCKDYGEAYVYATSEENPTLASAAKVDIFDTVIHEINVANEYEANYVGIDEQKKLDISTKPSMTHIVNQTLNFEVTEGTDVVDTTRDGTILPKKEGTAKIKITSDDEKSKAAKEITVKVGKGVNVLSLDNPVDEVISDKDYSLFDHIETAPEKIDRTASIMNADASKITATDFTYTSSDEKIAVVDKYGNVTFQLPGTATFTITYKRNPNLKATKKIESTCSQLKQVYFTSSLYELPATATNEDLNNLVDWYAYPNSGAKTKYVEGVEIISSNENVVEAIPGNGAYSLQIKGVGSTTLTAKIKVNETTYKSDSCQVNILLPESDIFIEPTLVTTDSCYYPLRKNIKNLKDINAQYPLNKLTFSLDYLESNAEIIDNEILFIKDPAKEINVNVEWTKADSSSASGSFKVKASNAKTIEKDFIKSLVIPAGQITKIKGWEPVLTSKSYEEKFATINGGFVAKCGQSIDEFEVKDANGNKDTIKLIVTEDPLYIASNSDTLYTTNEYEVNFVNTIAPRILPSTATKADGSRYLLNTEYFDKVGSKVATIENDVITYSTPGSINAMTKCSLGDDKYLQQEYTIASTYGDTFGRFEITDKDGNKVNSYQTLELNPADPTKTELKLYCSALTWATFNNMQIKSTTGLCSVSKDWKGLVLTGNAEFTVKVDPATKKYGTDIIEISSSAFSVFINVKVSPFVTDVSITKGGVELDDVKANKTYTTDLKIKAQASPCVVSDPGITATFNNEACTINDGIITLPTDPTKWTEDENNKLVVTATGGFTKEIKFNYSKEDPKFDLEGCEQGLLYLTSNATQKVCKVVTDGFVDDSWYSKLEYKLDSTKHGEQVDLGKYLSIYGIKLPEAENYEPYTNTLDVWVKDKESTTKKTYSMGRDFVSRIEFPGHDNTDMTDKKGLQKVHVYGNHSYYKEDMKEVDYYKLPVKLYGFDHQEIKNSEKYPEAVLIVLNTLKASFGNSNSTYKFTNDGYIEIHFHKDDLYTFDEILDDAFDSKQNKNVTFSLSTWSNEAKAQYTFVATDGINQYCQEGLKYAIDTYRSYTNVLQTNFGMTDSTKQNTPLNLDVWLSRVMGNGYTINFDALAKIKHAQKAWWLIESSSMCNVTLKAQEKATMETQQDAHSEYSPFQKNDDDARKIKYSTIMDFANATNVSANELDLLVSKTLFRENKTGVFYQDKNINHKFCLEDVIFFDTASIPSLGLNSKIYIKGFIDLYNFHGQEMLKNIPGVGDISYLWPILESIGKEKDMINRGADGKSYVNTFAANALSSFLFYNHATGQYEASESGLPGSGQYLSKFANVGIGSLNASFWATPNAETHSGAPSYYDEYDKDGNIRLDFLHNQMIKITREIKYF